MIDLNTAWQFGAALGLGMLIGLERERTRREEKTFAGVRTFALVALLGATSVFAGGHAGLPWIVGVVFAALVALVAVAYFVTAKAGSIGATTEISLLLTFFIGSLCAWDQVGVAGAVAVAAMLLLALKGWLHNLAKRIEPSDVEATLKFAIITLIILPLVPDTNFGPTGLEVINPYKTWLMVVLIAGLNFFGYILVKVVGREHGLGITGLLGGLVSSTAVTLSFSQRSRVEPGLAPVLALAILLAWTVMFFRVVVEVGVVNLSLAKDLALGMVIMGGVSLVICFLLWRRGRSYRNGGSGARSQPFRAWRRDQVRRPVRRGHLRCQSCPGLFRKHRAVSGRGTGRSDRCRRHRPVHGQSRPAGPGQFRTGSANDRHCGDIQHHGQVRHGDLAGRAIDAADHDSDYRCTGRFRSGRGLPGRVGSAELNRPRDVRLPGPAP